MDLELLDQLHTYLHHSLLALKVALLYVQSAFALGHLAC